MTNFKYCYCISFIASNIHYFLYCTSDASMVILDDIIIDNEDSLGISEDNNVSGDENMLTVASVSVERMVVDDSENEVVAIGTETLVAVDDGEGIAALELDGAKEETEAAVVGNDVEETIVYKINNKNRHTIII